MKRNVDLTENMDFTFFSKKLSSLTRGIKDIYFPWDFNKIIPVTNTLKKQNKKEILFTGTKKDRKYKKMRHYFETALVCECCRKSLSNMPWRNHYILCGRCYDNLDKTYNKKPWRK